jgi:hypothetical protein
VMEPRNWRIVGAFVVAIAGAVPHHRIGLVSAVLPGSESRA